uniref:Chromosome condensation regulator RCC1 repeat protein,Chromosome condensation regulator RCC1 repeat protein,Chromosome condensation regulator RCC1 repeat protein,Chromosome condensation regulator RCC1 repeat protein,chain 150 n=2 Tax=Tetrahymena thermophila TaxID=5911 RepID=UPI000150A62B|nr:Chain DL, Chromosome condensation regulator RCC1 repeat protein,Chromosome condensation regulator RCC1 repeat protein,Chromosome condensation regulator RCC1 repeat protein,chain 150 [Tetrahymena thermophila SB210]8BQS_Dl Chain Dl, Chromosome condensation regulator RCC1 repeat protein,Chromosome condensation regulator RCC1 repeat protein,Chromosome condensation regulator RCC1 repeat protein,chain 150 [Tetrahymena thermophila SB210]8GYM_BP Chain BP, Chromosome condensation regulator RCC1 repeat 
MYLFMHLCMCFCMISSSQKKEKLNKGKNKQIKLNKKKEKQNKKIEIIKKEKERRSNPQMISKTQAFARLFQLSSKSFSTVKGGNLYTWGQYASGTGFETASAVPRKVDYFSGNVSKVAMGPYHTAVITNDGSLYTFGWGQNGALGNGAKEFQLSPSPVSFFNDKKLKVKDVVVGESYTIAVTENGEVYSWGYGGEPSSKINLDFFRNAILPQRCGALGSGDNKNRLTPQQIANLKADGYKNISGGDNFATLVNQSGEVINWGTGLFGSLGNGSDYPLFTPEVNAYFKHLKEHEGLTVQSIKSAGHFSAALLSNGKLYTFGVNTQGQLGIRENLGHNTDQNARLPTPVVDRHFVGQKVVDFEVGENTLVFLTDKNEVFFSGLELAYQPIRWEIPTDKKIVKLAASKDTFAAVTETGKIYQFNEFVGVSTNEVGNDYNVADSKAFEGKVVDLGGSYGIRFAIVN